jgi:hypothetical protein
MENHKKESDVQIGGCFALFMLFDESDISPCTKAAVDGGAIKTVLTAMENHPNNANLQKHGCQFLYCLAKSHEDYRNSIVQSKGLTAVTEARRIHQDNTEVVSKALTAIA